MLRLLKNISWDWSQGIKDYSNHLKGQVQSKTFRNLSVLTIAFFVFVQALVPGSASALNPRFNFLAGDYELLRGANSTAGEQDWHDPISGKIGDVISWNVYYHNGVEQTTAHNTKIQVNLPDTASTQLKLQGKLWADNADLVSDYGTVNLNTAGKIRYIPNSTIWYKDGSTTPQNLPDGITEAGVNLGDIQGCWPYAGFVVFQTEIVSSIISIEIDKKVGNSSEDPHTQNWYKENIAEPNQTLAYRLYIKNTGNDTIQNLKVRDILPEHVSYISGTTKAYTYQTGTDGQELPDGITSSSGINLGSYEPGDVNSGFIVFQVKIANLTNPGTYTLTNTAESWADNVAKKQSTATTIVNIGEAQIQKSKTAFNQTQNQDATKVVAKAGDIINYNLWTKNNGTATAKGFVVNDDIADILEYADITNMYGGVLNGKTITYPAIDIETGKTINKTFTVKVKNPIPSNPQNGKSYDFKMENIYGNTILINIFKSQIGYHFDKKVRNISRGESSFVETVQATYGEELEYKILVANTGNTDLTNVLVWDKLPNYQKLVAGSVRFYGPSGGSLQLSDNLVTTGVQLQNFSAGLSGYVVFKVRMASCPPAGSYNLVNTAYAVTHQTGQVSDTAKTVLTVYPPIEPPVK
ncbi:hypothetical protein ACFL14_01700 [Patescibacteria group bacterium]